MSEKKMINYNGMELETITEGYWPEGATLISGGGTCVEKVVCLRAGRVITAVATTLQAGSWAILPPKPAPRRLTNLEVYALWRKGWDILGNGDAVVVPMYCIEDENKICDYVKKLRAPGSDEWLEPTSELLEVGK